MTSSDMEITEEDFHDRFPLIRNHLREDASWSVGDDGGCLFETFGQELEFVRRQHAQAVWTLVDSEEGLVLLSGFHLVNRVGYLISSTQLPPGVTAFVRLGALR